MTAPLIELKGVSRVYPSGDQTVTALDALDLTIESGEMIAIVGSSGSGKSTLMNILGCLDRPTAGTYRIAGQDVGALGGDALAALRREHFGFVFQRYHLMSRVTALGNVELPAIYAGTGRQARRERARKLLTDFGLGDRLHHRPNQLSGGQQQRVSIARALINGGQIVLADEPTGALDRATGEQIMATLRALHAQGHTIIVVTHNMAVAKHADRVIELSDGRVLADRRLVSPRSARGVAVASGHSWSAALDRMFEAFRIAFLAMRANRLRSFLTMLGICIGIAAVVAMVALGDGSREYIMNEIRSLGTNTVEVFPGKDWGDMWSSGVMTLTPADADSLAGQSFVDSVTPFVESTSVARRGNITLSVDAQGVGVQYFRVHGVSVLEGRTFSQDAVDRRAQEAVIDEKARDKLFKGSKQVVGETFLIGTTPFRVIGVAETNHNMSFGGALQVWTPYTTLMTRVTGIYRVQWLTVRVADSVPFEAAKFAVQQALTLRHGRKDFFIQDNDAIRRSVDSTMTAFKLFMSLVAALSLLIGGIGIMNITLVSVTERTQEIGLRMAVGARQSDIRNQFLVEAIAVCLVGGLIGLLLAFVIGFATKSMLPFPPIYSLDTAAIAFGSSTLIGLIFGFMPARNAAKLDPVEALARE